MAFLIEVFLIFFHRKKFTDDKKISNWTDTKVGKIPVCPKALTDAASTLSLTHDRLAAVTRACHGIFTGFDTEEIGKII